MKFPKATMRINGKMMISLHVKFSLSLEDEDNSDSITPTMQAMDHELALFFFQN